jgi:tetratricopeptide (TPR) repeat protein
VTCELPAGEPGVLPRLSAAMGLGACGRDRTERREDAVLSPRALENAQRGEEEVVRPRERLDRGVVGRNLEGDDVTEADEERLEPGEGKVVEPAEALAPPRPPSVMKCGKGALLGPGVRGHRAARRLPGSLLRRHASESAILSRRWGRPTDRSVGSRPLRRVRGGRYRRTPGGAPDRPVRRDRLLHAARLDAKVHSKYVGAMNRGSPFLRAFLGAIAILTALGCGRGVSPRGPSPAGDGDTVVSLLGQTLAPTPLPADLRRKREAHLDEARARFERAPNDPDAQIWFGRRTAYLGRYREAIAIFSDGITKHPRDARFLRHRGHRYLTVRRFDAATADLARAAELVQGQPDAVEPDGQPNAKGIPTTTLHSNIYYHLGLAHYLRGDFPAALLAYEACARAVSNDDHLVSSTYWRYLTLRRLGRHEEATALLARIPDELNLLENHAYHRLLMFYAGRQPEPAPAPLASRPDKAAVDDPTLGYGLGAWHLVEGRSERATVIFRETAARPMWGAFGAIAAEAELARPTTP